MVRVFQVDDYDIDETSLSSSLGLAEVACTALDDVILSDLTTTWEVCAICDGYVIKLFIVNTS